MLTQALPFSKLFPTLGLTLPLKGRTEQVCERCGHLLTDAGNGAWDVTSLRSPSWKTGGLGIQATACPSRSTPALSPFSLGSVMKPFRVISSIPTAQPWKRTCASQTKSGLE